MARSLLSCVLFILLSASVSMAQSNSPNSSACADCEVTEDRTLNETRKCAIQNAIEKAMTEAGVAKRVRSSSLFHQSEQNREYTENFQEVFTSEFMGAVRNVRVVNENRFQDDLGDFLLEVCIECEVIVHNNDPDAGFIFEIEGLLPAYPNPSSISFSASGSSGYMYGFMLEGENVFPFFPNENEKKNHLESGNTYEFPHSHSQQEYIVYNDSPEESKLLVLVFLKQEAYVPTFDHAQTLWDWINSIEPDQRFLFIHPFAMSR